MRSLVLISVLASLALLAMFWMLGGERVLLSWAVEGQRTAQTGMARALRGLRAGEAAAVIPLLAVCFVYGFFHAVGPGHGKLLIGAYGAAREVGAVRLSAIALVSSLAQGATAILLVGGGLWVWGMGRERMTDLAEHVLQPLGFAAIAAIGFWLVLRGLRGVLRRSQAAGAHTHDHDHACGHPHGPAPEAVAAAAKPRELAAMIGAVAIRPCTGALFLLVLTAQMGVFAWGVAGTLVMALGTASVTVAVALSAVGLRTGALAGLDGGAGRIGRVQPILEIVIGLAVAWIAGSLALATI